MPGQSEAAATLSFLCMWMVMTAAMMLPSLVPVLLRCRDAVRNLGQGQADRFTTFAAAGYFLFWALIGMAAYAVAHALTAAELRMPALASAVPVATGIVIAIAGALQFSPWKTHHLECYRGGCCEAAPPGAAVAWRYGLQLGWHCSHCCGGLMAILLAVGIMDLRAMAAVTVAITAERLLPGGERIAKVIGVLAIFAGLLAVVRAAGA
jgi:predicted metal-binding membrane protein